jgi:hypothetical protein
MDYLNGVAFDPASANPALLGELLDAEDRQLRGISC